MSLSERLRHLVERVTPPTRRFVTLEEQTQIKAETWRTWWNRGGKASADMIQGMGQAWPEYAFWLVTGITDQLHGHRSANDEDIEPPLRNKLLPRTAARDYFLKQLALRKWCEENSWKWAIQDEDDYYDSSIGEHTDSHAKALAKLHGPLWGASVIRDDQEETIAKVEKDKRLTS